MPGGSTTNRSPSIFRSVTPQGVSWIPAWVSPPSSIGAVRSGSDSIRSWLLLDNQHTVAQLRTLDPRNGLRPITRGRSYACSRNLRIRPVASVESDSIQRSAPIAKPLQLSCGRLLDPLPVGLDLAPNPRRQVARRGAARLAGGSPAHTILSSVPKQNPAGTRVCPSTSRPRTRSIGRPRGPVSRRWGQPGGRATRRAVARANGSSVESGLPQNAVRSGALEISRGSLLPAGQYGYGRN